MPKRHTQKLRTVTSFPDLVDYLRDELDWPIEVEDADEIVFHYEPDELGIDPKHAVKINSIRQIRPLAEGQPWGVFYIDFESKKLPVVVLRRILRALVPGNRSRQAERPVWDMDDLLFISAFGDQAARQREIAFAHFNQGTGDLPTLRVLGWDGSDTPLKLEYVDATLRRKMHWPDDPDDHDTWREAWANTFRHRVGHVIRTADALAQALAGLARRIRDAAALLLAHEAQNGHLRRLHKAFQTALIHDLSEADFADTYAQTITYGLLTAAISRTEMSDGQYGTALVAENVADIVPVTNPFLKEMLQTFLQAGGRKGGIDFDELGIQDVVELLRGDETDLPAVLRDFGNKTQGEDPVIHFYEHFLAAYDKALKVQRGVFYTPKPVVSYIVRSVHELLQTEFGLADGLADTTTWGDMAQRNPDLTIPDGTDPDSPFVVILDPATGTATFLVEVIDVIYQTMTAKWRRAGLSAGRQQAAWNAYVPQHLLPRLHGYELMMAPYAIAHMKMGLKLYETGYRFGSDERVRIYLTNTMEKPDHRPSLAGILPALAHEAQAVNHIKQEQSFTVVIGNPPYSGHSANKMKDDWIGLRDEYYTVDGKPLREHNPKYLLDDYVKFIRFGQQKIELTRVGILALITNHGYLDNPTFRGMRESLLQAFDGINVLDLHGNKRKKEVAPDGNPDENVFDIMQGVTIGLLVKLPNRINTIRYLAKVCNADLFGLRKHKYE
ncbi:MAG: N-6 DNA methylase, partial [Anaerolineae bacterium]